MKKKILSLGIVTILIAMLMLLTGCGKETENNSNTNNSESISNNETTNENQNNEIINDTTNTSDNNTENLTDEQKSQIEKDNEMRGLMQGYTGAKLDIFTYFYEAGINIAVANAGGNFYFMDADGNKGRCTIIPPNMTIQDIDSMWNENVGGVVGFYSEDRATVTVVYIKDDGYTLYSFGLPLNAKEFLFQGAKNVANFNDLNF